MTELLLLAILAVLFPPILFLYGAVFVLLAMVLIFCKYTK